MNFNYTSVLSHTKIYPEYHFHFTLTQDEVHKVIHKYNFDKRTYMEQVFGNPSVDRHFKLLTSIEIIRDSLCGENVDLGIDYKKKYEELVELLEPHKIDDMPPETTLKMILKYNK